MKDSAIKYVNVPQVDQSKEGIRFFNSFEEMNAYDVLEMSKLTPLECLQRLRHSINLAYGMHGYDPDQIPTTRNIQIISYSA